MIETKSSGMEQTRVSKSVLLEKIKQNKETHVKEYNEAREGYKIKALEQIKKAQDELKKMIKEVESGGNLGYVNMNLPVPVSYEKQYVKAIIMLEMSVDEVITLSSSEIECYVMDEWSWKKNFAETSVMYGAVGKANR